MRTIDLNADVGESFGAWTMGRDAELIPLLTSVNIACGFHAGDPATIAATVALAKANGVAIGAHPGYPDLQGFGRRVMQASEEEAYQWVLYQAGAVRAFAQAVGERLHHVKAHGALYNQACIDLALSRGIVRAVKALGDNVAITVLAGSLTEQVARDAGLTVACEVFADRRYTDEGQLVSRKDPKAMITSEDESIRQVVAMLHQGRFQSVSGREISVKADTICLHGDQLGAVAFARAVRQALTELGIVPRTYP